MSKLALVADDSDVIRRTIASLLHALQFDVIEVDGVSIALAACAKNMPSLIILDWLMPADAKTSASSLGCIQSLRRMPGGNRTVVLYCTTEHDPIEFNKAINAGADDVIVKPFDRLTLQRKLLANKLLVSG